MAERSLRASQAAIARVENALTDKGWSRQDLADRVVIEGKKTTTGISIQTIHKFLTGEKVDRKYFVGICKALDLPWNEIEESAKQPKPECPQPKQGRDSEIDALVQEVRQRVQPYIQERCGTMRVLDMTQPIALGEIYTNVNILEKLTKTRGLELAALMRDANPEKFDRFCLGDVRERRLPGLKAVEQFSKLMILGKPGAGKTTFLKHLAIQCIGGKFLGDRVPVFIILKDFAEADGKTDLLDYISRLVVMPSVGAQGLAPLQSNVAVIQEILCQGLLVERARGIYSFSHLTFQEYFTARKIVTSCNSYASDDPTLQGLVSHLAEKRWREVFLLTVGMLDSADVLLKLIKAWIDELLAGDEKFQQFLGWINRVGTSRRTSIVRFFHFALATTLIRDLMNDFDFDEAIEFDELDSVFDQAISYASDGTWELAHDLKLGLENADDLARNFAIECTDNLICNFSIQKAIDSISDYDFNINRHFATFGLYDDLWNRLTEIEDELGKNVKSESILVITRYRL